jgi:hypothetical protein
LSSPVVDRAAACDCLVEFPLESKEEGMMKRMLSGAVVVAFVAQVAVAADLYGPDQMTDGSGWGLNGSADGDYRATFGYDYSADGIPEAPNSQPGDVATSGMKAEANLVDPAAAAFFSAYPIGQNFTGTHQLTFDAWMNFSSDDWYNNGQAGTTEFLGGGIGYDGLSADIGSGAQMIATGEGGSGSDWRAFKDGFFVAAADMAAGSRNGADPYYATFLPKVDAPVDQEQVPGGSIEGSPSYQWITWIFTNVNGIVTVDIQKPDLSTLRLVTMDCNDTSDGSSGCASEGNISLFYGDFFSSVTGSPELTFGLFDNVRVTDVPEPSTLGLLSVLALAFVRRR